MNAIFIQNQESHYLGVRHKTAHTVSHKMAMHKIKFTQFIILVAIKATTGQIAGMIFEGKNHLSFFVTKCTNIFSFLFYLLGGAICDCDFICHCLHELKLPVGS